MRENLYLSIKKYAPSLWLNVDIRREIFIAKRKRSTKLKTNDPAKVILRGNSWLITLL